MSATALPMPAHAPAVPEPSPTDSEGTRLLPRRDVGGRFAPRAVFNRCEGCGWTLAEDLAARLYCANGKCGAHRVVVGTVPGVDPGTVTAEVLAVGT